jgi:hypothetical protein
LEFFNRRDGDSTRSGGDSNALATGRHSKLILETSLLCKHLGPPFGVAFFYWGEAGRHEKTCAFRS